LRLDAGAVRHAAVLCYRRRYANDRLEAGVEKPATLEIGGRRAGKIRAGKRPDGRMLAPIMPWAAFAKLTGP
jgi:hypothetical protein